MISLSHLYSSKEESALEKVDCALRQANDICSVGVGAILCLSNLSLRVLPISLYSQPSHTGHGFHSNFKSHIVRIDLSHNCLTSGNLESLCFLVGLRELWLSYNPLTELPDIRGLNRLEMIDINHTQIKQLPPYVCTLSALYEIDWRGTPFESTEIAKGGLKPILDDLRSQHDRHELTEQLKITMTNFYSRKGVDKYIISNRWESLKSALESEALSLEDFKQFVRRAESYLPDQVADISPSSLSTAMAALRSFQRATLRQRISADLEISLRSLYGDGINRSGIETIIRGVYQAIPLLEDIQFLLQHVHGAKIFPIKPVDATDVSVIVRNMKTLQSSLSLKRQKAIDALTRCMSSLYPEITKDEVSQKAKDIAIALRESEEDRFPSKRELVLLARVAADCEKQLPPDFAAINPSEVAMKFRAV